MLAKCGQKTSPKLTLVPEYRIERARTSVIVDGALVDLYHLPHGYWEAKDENVTRTEALVDVVNQFFDYKAPHIKEWEAAVSDFSERIPELATASRLFGFLIFGRSVALHLAGFFRGFNCLIGRNQRDRLSCEEFLNQVYNAFRVRIFLVLAYPSAAPTGM